MPETHRQIGWKRAVLGAVLALLGSAGLSFVIWAPVVSDAWSIRLGLAPGAALSAAAQVMAIVGVWMLWSAFRSGR